jgi:endoglucanase
VSSADRPHLLVTAHADQVGLCVSHVDERGFIWMQAIGWVSAGVLPGGELIVSTASGPVGGVVGTRPPHLSTGAEPPGAPRLEDLCLDIGACDRESALRRVSIGDSITFAPRFFRLQGPRHASIACDNRAGVYTVVRFLESLTDDRAAAVQGLFSVREETAFTGARAATLRVRPDIVIVVDGDLASDHPGMEPRRDGGLVCLGKGPVLARGTGTSPPLFDLVTQVAREEGIPLQVRATAGAMLTDADELMACGAAVISLSIPMRYVHSPLEVIDTGDLEATEQLLTALAPRLMTPTQGPS